MGRQSSLEKIKTYRKGEVPLDKSLLLSVSHPYLSPILAAVILVKIHTERFLCIYLHFCILRENNGVFFRLPKTHHLFLYPFLRFSWEKREVGWNSVGV